MTFSIAARCASTGSFGIAISSSSPAVAARCAHVRSGVGAVCSQNVTDPRLGPALLDRLEGGEPARTALDRLVESTPNTHFRQLSVIDRQGRAAVWSGERCLGVVATATGDDVVAAGNLLAAAEIPELMIAAFASSFGRPLGDRLIAALQAAMMAGGEKGPVHSAGMVIVDQVSWPTTDLRVDWSDDPVGDLAALWRLWRPQIDAYLTRVLDPANAPGYGVPGDSTA
jgi:uncharacterized Ntn-hydrolase superfamily protein